jgi:cullin-associated NEDD8-dissociated protein 1
MSMTPAPIASAKGVSELLHKLSDQDPDFRFMSLNDLLQVLNTAKPDFLHHDYNTSARTVDGLLKALDDQNGEVQNLAIKCLGPLVGKVPPTIIAPLLDKLSTLKLKNSVDNTVPRLALRSVVLALPKPVVGMPITKNVQEAYDPVSRVLIPRLVGTSEHAFGMLQSDTEANAEAVDVLIEVLRCFGPMLQGVEVESMLEIVLRLVESNNSRSAVKKRAVVAIAMLAVYLTNDNLEAVVERMTSNLSQPNVDQATRRLYISIIGSMARSIPSRFGPHLPKVVPYVFQAIGEEELQTHMEKISDGDDLGQEFNDVREAALVTLEAFLASCPQEMRNFTKDTIAGCLRYLKYDPNYAMDEDDEDMEVDEEDEDEDDEFDADDGFEDDDDDASWKVRRCAAKTLYTLISTRGSGDLLDNGVLYSQAAPQLVKRMGEREENVRLEVISALSLLVRKTGEGLHLNDRAFEDLEQDTSAQMPLSRKRRRQSSGGGGGSVAQFMSGPGLTSPVLEKVPPTGPRADLASIAPSIVKAATKQLKGKTIPTKQAVLSLLDDMVSAQRGGLSEFFPEVIGPIIEAVRGSGPGVSSSLTAAGGSASATPSTLRVTALSLIGDLAKTHSSSVLHPYLAKIVTSVTSAVSDRFYKVSSEAIRTVEELVKAITPPRSRNDGAKFKGELQTLFDAVMERASAIDADAEVRQRAIHALGVLIARTMSTDGSGLLPADKRKSALGVIQERLKNETSRLAAVRAVDNVAAFANSPGQLEKPWIQDVVSELSAQLRKADRSLRGSSVMALKHLITSEAAKNQLEPATIERIVSSLMPAITNGDAHLLGPAMVILASILPGNADLVVTKNLITSLCQLLKSHLASIVLEPLLSLVSSIGQSGTGVPLMQGLLKDVSVAGDASVVGKVIGTLLVTGGKNAGVSLDSFINELKTSAKSGDDARVSLALAVIGEAGMRLGTDSPIEPSLFLEQFHEEPDKASLAAAVALGHAGSGNVPQYLPVILETMQQGGNTQYLLIHSVKEILQSASVQSPDLRGYAQDIWNQLLKSTDNADNRVICAECVGRLVSLDPKDFLPQLQTLLKDSSSSVRGMAVQAVRYALPESDEALDAMLKNVLIDMLLVMLQDKDMVIRRLAMTTLNSAARSKPDLILPHMSELAPFVLAESVIKPELIREVMLGPFKHIVDDGLEVRKNAYETLYALMELAFTRLNNIDLYDRVIAGLKDDNDIRQICNLMVTKLIVIDPDESARRLDSIAEAYRSVLSIKLKENAVKQDVEKQQETNKSILRVTMLLGEKMKSVTGNAGAAMSNASVAASWAGYWEWVNKEYSTQLKDLREESREMQPGK